MSAKFQISERAATQLSADTLVIIVDEAGLEGPLLEQLDAQNGGGLFEHLERINYRAAPGACQKVPLLQHPRINQLILVGRKVEGGSESADAEAVAIATRSALSRVNKTLSVAAATDTSVHALTLGAALGTYQFNRYFFEKKMPLEPQLTLALGRKLNAKDKADFKKAQRIAEGVCLARDLVNEPPNELYPKTFADIAKRVAKKRGLTAKILDHKGIIKAKMLLHDAVGKGSSQPPYFIHLTYKPARKAKAKVAFVGKGLTFDSGGLCIKPTGGMLTMKSDMAGGGAVLGLMDAVSALGVDVEVHGIIGAAENMPDAAAYRPSDVIKSLSGKGVEVINTDAEGRLVLADALTYAARLEPDFIVDAATLTGATMVSLGDPYSAFFTDHESIATAMTEAAATAGESFWRMPLIQELRAQLDSSITDLKHTGNRWGGAITAALFLREFTAGVPWMHCDIPGPTFRDRASGMHPKGGTGHAVMTFLELIQRHSNEAIVSASVSKKSIRAKKTVKKAAAKKKSSKKVTSSSSRTSKAIKKTNRSRR